MKVINNLSMRSKLILLVLPALLVILFFAAGSILRSIAEYQDMSQLQVQVDLVQIGDPLVENLQRERGRTALLLAAEPGSDAHRRATGLLENQRLQTNRAIAEYRSRIQALLTNASLDQVVIDSINRLEAGLNDVNGLRQEADRQNLSVAEAVGRYTELTSELIDRIPLLIRRATDAELAREINAYYALAQVTETSGRERASGAAVINAGEFNLSAIGQVTRLSGQQSAWFESATEMLGQNSAMRQQLNAYLASPAVQAMRAQRETLLSSTSGIHSLSAEKWFDITTDAITGLNTVRNRMLSEAEGMAADEVAGARNHLITTSVIAGSAIVFVIILVSLIMNAISRQVRELLDGVQYAMDQKDLSRPIPVSSRDEIGAIAQAINSLFRRFGEALAQIDKASIQLATATEETSSTANQNSTQIRDQQQQIEQVAAATEEMSATSEEISRNTQQVADASDRAMEKSHAGEQVLRASVQQIRELAGSVQEVNQVIEELENRSGTISEVVDVIRKVADQTNLLALNAAIEAARAGEHGRGFAVVADEVRTLAQQTHESTSQIEDIINGFKEITESASRSIITSHRLAEKTSTETAGMEQALGEILQDVNRISEMATQIATASEEQVSVTRELAGNMERVSESAILTLTGSQEITEVTTEQARLARTLQDLAHEFRVAG